jgi:hypothetical protein
MFPGTFTDEQRRIFSYGVAGLTRWADPLTVRRRLDHYLGRPLNDVLTQAASDDPVAKFLADEDLLRAARLALELPWDDNTGGATEAEIRDALRGLTDFLSGAATPIGTPRPNCTGSDPSSPFPGDMSPTSAYCST